MRTAVPLRRVPRPFPRPGDIARSISAVIATAAIVLACGSAAPPTASAGPTATGSPSASPSPTASPVAAGTPVELSLVVTTGCGAFGGCAYFGLLATGPDWTGETRWEWTPGLDGGPLVPPTAGPPLEPGRYRFETHTRALVEDTEAPTRTLGAIMGPCAVEFDVEPATTTVRIAVEANGAMPCVVTLDGATARTTDPTRLAMPEAFVRRPQVPSCGSETLQLGGGFNALGRRCFWDAYQSKTPAEFESTRPTMEGDNITSIYRVRPDGRVEVFIDSTRDRFGSGTWSWLDCRTLALEPESTAQPDFGPGDCDQVNL